MVDKTEPVAGQANTKEPKNLGGRPRKLTIDETLEVYNTFEAYIDKTNDPTVVDFVANNNMAIKYRVTRDNINDWPEFSTLIKRGIAKQEAYLLKEGGAGKYNPTLAIFRLKQPQHGYKDRTETDVTSGGEKLMGVGVSVDQAEQLIRARAKRSDI